MGTIILLKKPDAKLEPIDFEKTVVATWVDFVKKGEQKIGQDLNEDLESFLVFTLMRFMRRTDLFSVTLALEFLNASSEYTGHKKEQALSSVGDISLILAGLFPERTKNLNVSPSYFVEIGRMAFEELATSFERRNIKSHANLYHSVCQGFPFMAKVLLSAREDKNAYDLTSPCPLISLV
ncbi:hypothetical protein AUJ77_02310 [Candidatus Nomurabacteria bacterium CG1_02_43_90]|uniref:Uncharacterized protein n=1 Tax=Candidatus Nomurabacteria bacterium CG1_02_43_90 TaxID=1805281 RepID=A0A1J4V3R0_9BACT|nr:MAG: hypothetical protein AUJ77_02310 [Candidatus Nomurabacteria bacterium CG1_02_43_90]